MAYSDIEPAIARLCIAEPATLLHSRCEKIKTGKSTEIKKKCITVKFALALFLAASIPSPVMAIASQLKSSEFSRPAHKLLPFGYGLPANGATWFGATIGDENHNSYGWPTLGEMQSMADLGVKAIRLPIDPRYCVLPDGKLNEWVIKRLVRIVKFNSERKISTVLDAHTYRAFNDPTVGQFWAVFAPRIETEIGGPSPLFGIELANEPGKGNKNLNVWTEPLRHTIKQVRNSGYSGYIFAGAGDWNNMVFLEKALVEVERTGGAIAMDRLERTIYTGHDYWNKDSNPGKTRNDQGAAVDGSINIADRYGPTLNVARRLGVKVVMSELGGGISPTGPLPAFKNIGKDGKSLQEEYFRFAKDNEDVLIGSWFWMAGRVSPGYRHKIEAGGEHAESLKQFWAP